MTHEQKIFLSAPKLNAKYWGQNICSTILQRENLEIMAAKTLSSFQKLIKKQKEILE